MGMYLVILTLIFCITGVLISIRDWHVKCKTARKKGARYER